MLTPDYLLTVSDSVVDMYHALSDEIIQDIARRIANADYLTPTAEWQLLKLQEMGALQRNTIYQIAKLTKKSKREITRIMKQAGVDSLSYDDSLYKMNWLQPIPLPDSPALQAIMLQGADDTMKIIRNYTKSMASMASKSLENILDRTYLQVLSGAFSPTQAIRRSVNELASTGFESIAYPSGRNERVENVVRRAVTTSVNQSVGKLTLARMDMMDADLVEVSSHSGARPSHAKWQGKVYSLSGKSRKYPPFVSSTGYGTGDGLCGWNCHHNFYPYFEGLSSKSFVSDPAKGTGKSNEQIYEESQVQRKLERDIRQAKVQAATIKAASGQSDGELKKQLDSDLAKANKRIRERQAKLRDFLNQTGRTRYREREQIGKA